MIDVTAVNNINIGDEVVLFGKDVPIEYIAGLIGTINYELVCAVSHNFRGVACNPAEKVNCMASAADNAVAVRVCAPGVNQIHIVVSVFGLNIINITDNA